jgi:hypothetical protein
MHTMLNTDWRKRSLPRLSPEFYKGFAFVFWTHTLEDHKTGWLSDASHRQFRELLLHASTRHHLFCPVYTLMPDHHAPLGLAGRARQKRGYAYVPGENQLA